MGVFVYTTSAEIWPFSDFILIRIGKGGGRGYSFSYRDELIIRQGNISFNYTDISTNIDSLPPPPPPRLLLSLAHTFWSCFLFFSFLFFVFGVKFTSTYLLSIIMVFNYGEHRNQLFQRWSSSTLYRWFCTVQHMKLLFWSIFELKIY